ncbi:MAG: hypothetical protein CL677_09740 [Bdellovibrionaceae bacterium]|nr:hypothetical protein [Pseudobdellovibrionaceae bacterium]|tara:strand:+ start:357 stop:971 length:615 start_codon:yes stop_codon:yes gene_type:complete
MSQLDVAQLNFSYGENSLFKDFHLSLKAGEVGALLGPSGSGKSSLLHLICGFLNPQSGQILIGGEDVTALPPEERNVGVVFQDHALFPHMSVSENVGFGVRSPSAERERIIHRYLELVHLADRGKSMPSELSGGECQRIAIARCLAAEPKILLLDEAFSSLDEELRLELREDVKKIISEAGLTTLLVTHSADEAKSFSDRIFHL